MHRSMRIHDIASLDDDADYNAIGLDQGSPVSYTMAKFGKLVGLSQSTVARRIKDGKIRAIKIGRLVRIPASEIGRLFG